MFWRHKQFGKKKPKTLNVQVEGELGPGVTAKDLIFAIIAKFGVSFGNRIHY